MIPKIKKTPKEESCVLHPTHLAIPQKSSAIVQRYLSLKMLSKKYPPITHLVSFQTILGMWKSNEIHVSHNVLCVLHRVAYGFADCVLPRASFVEGILKEQHCRSHDARRSRRLEVVNFRRQCPMTAIWLHVQEDAIYGQSRDCVFKHILKEYLSADVLISASVPTSVTLFSAAWRYWGKTQSSVNERPRTVTQTTADIPIFPLCRLNRYYLTMGISPSKMCGSLHALLWGFQWSFVFR